MIENPVSTATLGALYGDFLSDAIRYFLRDCHLRIVGKNADRRDELRWTPAEDGTLDIEWFGLLYNLSRDEGAFGLEEMRLLDAIATVLSARYRALLSVPEAANLDLFRGVPEDRYVSAYLDPSPYRPESANRGFDRVASAIELLRSSSLTTYENRRITTGFLLSGIRCSKKQSETLSLDVSLNSIKTFNRLANGLDTVLLVDKEGLLIDVVDIHEWEGAEPADPLPAPSAAAYRAHARATLRDDTFCLVLTPNGEIKVFADGVQSFHYLNGRWRLTEAQEKFGLWWASLKNPVLAERLFTISLNMAEQRHGGLFVILDDPASVDILVLPEDRLDTRHVPGADPAKHDLHYLLRGKRLLDLSPAVVETVASVDGAIVVDRQSNLLAFGAILRHGLESFSPAVRVEGGRTTAAVSASRFGKVLKVSEDGFVSFFRDGRQVWEM